MRGLQPERVSTKKELVTFGGGMTLTRNGAVPEHPFVSVTVTV